MSYVSGAMRRKAEESARRWRNYRCNQISGSLKTKLKGTITLPYSSASVSSRSSESSTPAAVRVRIESNSASLFERLAFEYHGFFSTHQKQEKSDGEQNNFPPFATAQCSVQIHDGAPQRIGYPYSLEAEQLVFEKAVFDSECEATSRYNESHLTERRDALSLQKIERPRLQGSAPLPARWLTQPMLDGFVARRVEAQVGLTTGRMPDILLASNQLQTKLPARSVSPYVFADELCTSWGMFGDKCSEDAEMVRHVLRWAQVGVLMPLQQGVWMRGAAVSCVTNPKLSGDSESGETAPRRRVVLIVGPPRSGKTTLALHCLTASENVELVGADDFVLSAVPNGDPLSSASSFVVTGSPGMVNVGTGSVLGSLRSNPLVTQAAALSIGNGDATRGAEELQALAPQLMRNSELVIWDMPSTYPIHVAEAYGRNRWSPAVEGEIAGIVVLNWDRHELARQQSSMRTSIAAAPSGEEGYDSIVDLSQKWGDAAVFKGHYLLGHVCDEEVGKQRLSRFLAHPRGAPFVPVFEVGGAVSFDVATEFIVTRLLGEKIE